MIYIINIMTISFIEGSVNIHIVDFSNIETCAKRMSRIL